MSAERIITVKVSQEIYDQLVRGVAYIAWPARYRYNEDEQQVYVTTYASASELLQDMGERRVF